MKKFNLVESQKRCSLFRRRILQMTQKISALHLGGSYSAVELMDVLFNTIMTKNEKKNFILSKGHSSILQYVILEHQKILKKKDIENYCKKKGFLGVHPDRGNPGINASTGSLGHGLGMACGVALAIKKKAERVFCVLSDGELQEGSTWEAIMLAPSLKLNNLILIIDNNNFQSLEKTSNTHPFLYPLESKFKSFGWQSIKCDGHDAKKIYKIIVNKNKNKPLAIIAKTIKGYPISFMQNKPIWHYRSPSKKQYNLALKELIKKSP